MNELPNTEGLGMKVRTFQVLCFIVAAGLIAVGLVAIHVERDAECDSDSEYR